MGLYAMTPQGIELHPELLRAAAAMPLDAAARFDTLARAAARQRDWR